MKNKTRYILVSIFLFVGLQLIKPTIFMSIYRYITNFDPSFYSDFELYQMVYQHINIGSFSPFYTLIFILAEVIWLLIAFFPYYQYRSKIKSTE